MEILYFEGVIIIKKIAEKESDDSANMYVRMAKGMECHYLFCK